MAVDEQATIRARMASLSVAELKGVLAAGPSEYTEAALAIAAEELAARAHLPVDATAEEAPLSPPPERPWRSLAGCWAVWTAWGLAVWALTVGAGALLALEPLHLGFAGVGLAAAGCLLILARAFTASWYRLLTVVACVIGLANLGRGALILVRGVPAAENAVAPLLVGGLSLAVSATLWLAKRLGPPVRTRVR